MNNTQKFDIAVLTDTELLICRPGRRMERKPFNYGVNCVDQLHKAAIDYNLLSIWLVPGSTLSTEATQWRGGNESALPITKDRYDVRMQTEKQSGIPVWISLKQLTGSYTEKRLVHIGIPEHDSRWAEDGSEGWALADVEDSVTLLGALCYLQEALEGELLYSPGWTGINTMKIQNKHRAFDTKKPERNAPDTITSDILWTRPLLPHEKHMRYIHFYDRNSMYIAAAGGSELGTCEPDYVSGDKLEELKQGKLPPCAIWHVNVTPDAIIRCLPVHKGEMWLTTPEVYALAQIANMDVEITEAYIWQSHKRLLREWSNLVWQARVSLKTGHEECNTRRYPNVAARVVAYKLVKMVATKSIGWLGLGAAYGDQSRNEWHRPDWKNQVVGLARARMWLKIAEYWHGYDLAPVAVYTDALAYCSDDPDPRTAVPNLMIRETALGGFKHVRTVAISPEVVALFESDKAAWQIMHEVKQYGQK